MKLYYANKTCSVAIRILIHELGLKADYEAVDLKTKKTATGADYFQINPKGSVPAIVTANNEILTENSVIQQYLADVNHAAHLLPPIGDMKRYRILELLNFITTDLHKGCGPFFNPKVTDEMKSEIFRPILKKKLDYIDKVIEDKKYLMGDAFTLADIYMYVILSWFPGVGLQYSDFKNFEKYFVELKNRKSIQQSIAEEAK
jgi:glutathione S-transferase